MRAREAKDSTLTIASDLDNLEAALTQLQQMLEGIIAYVNEVLVRAYIVHFVVI